MARPDPALLVPARYPFFCQVAPRYGDLDPQNHINNVALSGLLEEGRLRLHMACTPDRPHTAWRIMTGSFAVEYLGQSYYPDLLDIHAAVETVGRSSFTVLQLAFQRESLVSFARTVLVWVDSTGASPIPEPFRMGMAPYMLRA